MEYPEAMGETLPLISVITPSLNSAAFMPVLLACIEHQDYPRVEHIVVDGCSTDGSLDVLDAADPSRHTVVVRKDRSMYEAINFGIGQSTGEVVACLNADDLYFPDTLSYVADFFRKHPEVDIAYGDQLTLFTDIGSFDPHVMVKEYGDPWGKVLVYISQPATFVRRRVFDRVGLFDADLKGAGDFEFWFRAFQKGMVFKKFKRTVVLVRVHGNNLGMTEKWWREYAELKARLLPDGWRGAFYHRYRRLKRKLEVNRLTVPFLVEFPPGFVKFDVRSYFKYLVARSPSAAPILSVDLPYFKYDSYRALRV
jgi:glycosyltransferase involved in cell wall biosynthesis